MRYPNTRYGNPNELLFYTQGLSVKDIAKRLKCSEKTVRNWRNQATKIPFWVPELFRLWHFEHQNRLRQMGFTNVKTRLGYVSDNIIRFPTETNKAKSDETLHPTIAGLTSIKRSSDG